MSNKSVDFVNVSVRIKPCVKAISSSLEIINNDPPILLVVDKSQSYHFDNIFTAEVNQKQVYHETVKPLVDNVKNGYNCTVFAYGQTGTGKTYTMGTNPDIRCEEDTGLISRALEDFFSVPKDNEEIEIYISFIEIYNEKVFDLLSSNQVPLSMKGFTVCGLEKNRIFETNDALLLLNYGGRNRHTGETKQNSNSSRSHAIFTIHYHWRNSEKAMVSKLNLVDLAGSESVRKTGNQGSSLSEGININRGLLSLGQVMTALSNNSNHVPYRQSVITTILQDSLNKKNYVSLIACVSPNTEDLGETLQTLEFSQRVKRIKNKPEVNHIITQYRRENPSARGSTPLKRLNDQKYETPFKKPRSFMPVITEPIVSDINSLDSSKSSFISCDNVPPNFSPIVKKYLSAMEESLMTKIEGVIENTLRSARKKSFNKENTLSPSTPSLPWDKISKIVRMEVLQLTGQVSRATSSPIEDHLTSLDNESRLKPKRLLEDVSASSIGETENSNLDVEAVFKIPAPVQKRKRTLPSPVKRRSSVRIQMKKLQDYTDLQDNPNRRRSIRLQKKTAINDQKDNELEIKNQRRNLKSVNFKSIKSPRSPKSYDGSPATVRMKQVLHTLNNGDVRSIATLHTIGPKTAEKILLLRQMKGNFESISDLSNMPYWTKNKYRKFLAENFLKDE